MKDCNQGLLIKFPNTSKMSDPGQDLKTFLHNNLGHITNSPNHTMLGEMQIHIVTSQFVEELIRLNFLRYQCSRF